MEPLPVIGQIVGPTGEGLHNICHGLRDLQAMCAEQPSEVASLRSDCTHYRKRFAEAVQNCATLQERLAEASRNEAALEQRRQHAESCVTQLKNALNEFRNRLEGAESLKTMVQARNQQLEERLEQYIKREAGKHLEVIQTMDKRMHTAMLRIAQYRQQRQRHICEARHMHQKIAQMNEQLLLKTRETEALRCLVESRDRELEKARLKHKEERAQLDARRRQSDQETQAAKLQCSKRNEELRDMRRSLSILRKQIDQKAAENELASSAKRQKEYELLEANNLCEQQRDQYEILLRQREETIEVSRATAAAKNEELQRKQEIIERQKLDFEQQRIKSQQKFEYLAYTVETKENDITHLRELLAQQKSDFEVINQQRDRDSLQKDSELQRARDTIREKQEALEAALEDCSRNAHAHEELRQATIDVRKRCDTLAEEHRQQLLELNNESRRCLETKVKEIHAQKELEIKRREEDICKEMRKAESETVKFERRRAAAELQHVQAMVMTMTDQNKGLVKQCKILSSKLEESTASVEKLKELLEMEKCKLLVSAKKASETPLLRQRLTALEKSIAVQKQQTHKLLDERENLRNQRKHLLCKLESLNQRCNNLANEAAQNEFRARDTEAKLLFLEQTHLQRESEMALLKEDLGSRMLETSTYKDNLKHIWTCVVEVLPVNAEAQAEVCVSQKMSSETVRYVHRLLREAAQRLCCRAMKNVGRLAKLQLENHLDVCKSNLSSERKARLLLEERLCAKERDLTELEVTLAAFKDKLSAAEGELNSQGFANSQAQYRILFLEEELKKAAGARETLENKLSSCEEKLTEALTQRNELQVELTLKKQKLMAICEAKDKVDEQLCEIKREEALLREERKRFGEECVQLEQLLMQERSRAGELEARAQKLQKNCHGTQKGCGVLLEAHKANCERMLEQAAREYEKRIHEFCALHQQELDVREETFRQKERRIIERLTSDATNREAALHVEIQKTRQESNYLSGVLRAKSLWEEKKQEEASSTIHRTKSGRLYSMSGCPSPCVATACVSACGSPRREDESGCSPRLPDDTNGASRASLEPGEANVSDADTAATSDIQVGRPRCRLGGPAEGRNEFLPYVSSESYSPISSFCDDSLPCGLGRQMPSPGSAGSSATALDGNLVADAFRLDMSEALVNVTRPSCHRRGQ